MELELAMRVLAALERASISESSMPFRKLNSLQEMEDSLWREPGDPQLFQAIRTVWNFAARTCPTTFPPGLYRHRSIEEADRQRELWEEQNFKALWERRGVRPDEV
jgi:hypothetical protein